MSIVYFFSNLKSLWVSVAVFPRILKKENKGFSWAKCNLLSIFTKRTMFITKRTFSKSRGRYKGMHGDIDLTRMKSNLIYLNFKYLAQADADINLIC